MWRRSPIKAQYQSKAEQDTKDEWTGPSASIQFEWALQSFLLPGKMALENRILLGNLTRK